MLEVRHLSVTYGEFQAVRDVSLHVREGEVVALLGPNAAGKTTTLGAIFGLVPAASGDVIYRGRSLVGRAPHERVRLGLALVPEGRELFPGMTVAEHLELGFLPGRDRFAEGLEQVYGLFPILGERRRQTAGTLSGGEQQMLAVGRALMARPSLLMLDEPSLGLAPRVVDSLYARLAALRGLGVTLLVVEQHVHEALALADRAYVMETGRIALEGPAHELLDHPYLRETYLAV